MPDIPTSFHLIVVVAIYFSGPFLLPAPDTCVDVISPCTELKQFSCI